MAEYGMICIKVSTPLCTDIGCSWSIFFSTTRNCLNLSISSSFISLISFLIKSMNSEDVDLEEKVMRVRHGKGDKDRIVIMSG